MPDDTSPDFLAKFGKDWDEFKKTNDAILAAKADGKSVAGLEEKLAKIGTSLDALNAVKSELDAVKVAMQRNAGATREDGSKATPEQMEHKAAVTRAMRSGDIADREVNAIAKKAMSVNDDAAGGFLVHADMSGRISRRIFETSPVRQYAAVATISGDALEGPYDGDEASYGWVSEKGSRAETATPGVGMYRIPTHEMYANPAATQKLLDDAAWDPEAWLADKVADRFSRAEANAFLLGTGAGRPRGILTHDIVAESTNPNFFGVKKLGYVPTGAADDFTAAPSSGSDPAQGDSLINLTFALKSWYREQPGTCFFMHRTTIGRVRRLRDAFGRYLWDPGINGATGQNILGYKVAEFNDMPQLGAANKYAIGFGNLRLGYQIVDRLGIRVLRDPFSSKPLIQFYTTKRTGGDVINFEAIKFLKFATT